MDNHSNSLVKENNVVAGFPPQMVATPKKSDFLRVATDEEEATLQLFRQSQTYYNH